MFELLRTSLGPRPRAVLIAGRCGAPLVCERGVTIARQLELREHNGNGRLGARLLAEAAVRTDEAVGDGTTTATLLAHALFVAGLRHVVGGGSATELERSWQHGGRLASAVLRRLARDGQGGADIVPGGGVALLRAAEAVETAADAEDGDRRVGLELLARALELPTRQIASNCGLDPERVVARVRAGSGWFGCDATTGRFGDLHAAGVVDVLEVVRVALDSAVAVAISLLHRARVGDRA